MTGVCPNKRVVRGFSLLELAVVVAMVGIVSTLAVPNMMVTVRRTQLDSTAASVAAFVAEARMEALSSRRCVRVVIHRDQAPAELLMQRLKSFDCHVTPTRPPFISGASSEPWITINRLVIPRNRLQVSWLKEPGDTSVASYPAGHGQHRGERGLVAEARWLPTGRMYSVDMNLANDDGVLDIQHLDLPGTVLRVVLLRSGMICSLRLSEFPVTTSSGLACP